jgi:hypothetical protein
MCEACGAKMDYAGSDDRRAYYECPSCGAEREADAYQGE